MFSKPLLKNLSILTIGISVIAAVLYALTILAAGLRFATVLPVITWLLLAYAGFCAYKLLTMDIYEEDVRNLGYYIYGLFAVFIITLLVGLTVGPILAFVITAKLHWQKKTIAEWSQNND